jgi:DNA-binding Lrp family transcriptional regulator
MDGFEILDSLYKNGTESVDDISRDTGISGMQVKNRLLALLVYGYVERPA